ncbi:hypothetical protein EMCG_01471 [[Emmonsia] crescens]|uniref:Uncharacterized protein n=1 Tax=[Emmonsia] crescens TaxID=73230 RepID=A0A0G2I1G3_9EURO|nr:hypothetical protein EMCG_01471 [Emmonsia crescens UAMH 3008]
MNYLSASNNNLHSNEASVPHIKQVKEYSQPLKGFLTLPLEMRFEIYSYLLVVDKSMDASGNLNKPLDKVLDLQILHLNTQIREEALYILLHKNLWIHFKIGPITLLKEDSYHIYSLSYAQPNILAKGFLNERLRQRFVAVVKVTQSSEFVEEQREDSEERVEVDRDILFVYNKGRYNHLCHLIRRFGACAVNCLNISIHFPEQNLRQALSLSMQLELVDLLSQTKNVDSLIVHGAEMLHDSFKRAKEKHVSYLQNTSSLRQFNDELEEIISRSAIALNQGLYNEAKCHLSYVNDIQAIHLKSLYQSDSNEVARQGDLERDMLVIQVLTVVLYKEKCQPNCAINFLSKLDLMCGTLWAGESNCVGLLSYAREFLSRRTECEALRALMS